jgi:methionyl-tRNA formyltransferase
MGTPEIAVPCLDATVAWADGRVRVVTQPDRPKGRSGEPQPSPVKARARARGLEVVQPSRLRGNEEMLAWLRREPPDVIVVVAFGQILPPAVLNLPRLGCVNVHYSLLPRYRGAAPVQWALIRGERETGVDTMLMDEGLDTGPLLRREVVAIGPDETAGELLGRLAAIAPGVLTRTLEELTAGAIIPSPQDESRATAAPRLGREDGRIAWEEDATAIANRVRGVTPWPGATALLAGEEVKVLRASAGVGRGEPGAILAVDEARGILCAAAKGAVWLSEVQAPGRRPVSGAAYAHGRRLSPGP